MREGPESKDCHEFILVRGPFRDATTDYRELCVWSLRKVKSLFFLFPYPRPKYTLTQRKQNKLF